MKITLTIIHNKTDAENAAQITALQNMLTVVTDGPFLDLSTNETYTTTHHELIGLNVPHEVYVRQIIPFGVTPPPNRYDINSGGITQYTKEDDLFNEELYAKQGIKVPLLDKNIRYYRHAFKRGLDIGSDVSIVLEDVTKFTPQKLIGKLNALTNKNDATEYVEDDYGKMVTAKMLREVGHLKEDRTLSEAITELKRRIVGKGLKHG